MTGPTYQQLIELLEEAEQLADSEHSIIIIADRASYYQLFFLFHFKEMCITTSDNYKKKTEETLNMRENELT